MQTVTDTAGPERDHGTITTAVSSALDYGQLG
jgi:hypothetical protein